MEKVSEKKFKIVSLTDHSARPIFRRVNMTRTGVSIVRNIHPIEVFSMGPYIIPLIGAVIAIISGLLGLYKYQELWIEYRTVSESLKHEKFLYLTKSEPYGDTNAFTNLVKSKHPTNYMLSLKFWG